jgi:hypothetical protein
MLRSVCGARIFLDHSVICAEDWENGLEISLGNRCQLSKQGGDGLSGSQWEWSVLGIVDLLGGV